MTMDPIGPLKVVRTNQYAPDTAIDTSKTDLAEYRKTRNPALVHAKDGHKLAWFTLVPIKHEISLEVLDAIPNESVRNLLSFQLSCHEIELPDGKVILPKKFVDGGHGSRLADDEWVATVRDQFGIATIREMGRIAWERVQLPASAMGPFFFRAG